MSNPLDKINGWDLVQIVNACLERYTKFIQEKISENYSNS